MFLPRRRSHCQRRGRKNGPAKKKTSGAAEKKPAGALNEEGGDPDADEISADDAMGGADAEGEGDEDSMDPMSEAAQNLMTRDDTTNQAGVWTERERE